VFAHLARLSATASPSLSLTSLWIESLQAFQAAASLLYLFRQLADSAAKDAITFRPSFFNLLRSQPAGSPHGQSL
jgi:hypothetical protein